MDVWDSVTGFFRDVYKKVENDIEYVKGRYDAKFNQYYDESEKYRKWLGIEGRGVDDKVDAFRHIFSSAQATRDYGEDASKVGGWLHELGNAVIDGATIAEVLMDASNNRLGRDIGAKAEEKGLPRYKMAEDVMRAMNEGKSVNSPSQKRPSILDYYRRLKD